MRGSCTGCTTSQDIKSVTVDVPNVGIGWPVTSAFSAMLANFCGAVSYRQAPFPKLVYNNARSQIDWIELTYPDSIPGWSSLEASYAAWIADHPAPTGTVVVAVDPVTGQWNYPTYVMDMIPAGWDPGTDPGGWIGFTDWQVVDHIGCGGMPITSGRGSMSDPNTSPWDAAMAILATYDFNSFGFGNHYYYRKKLTCEGSDVSNHTFGAVPSWIVNPWSGTSFGSEIYAWNGPIPDTSPPYGNLPWRWRVSKIQVQLNGVAYCIDKFPGNSAQGSDTSGYWCNPSSNRALDTSVWQNKSGSGIIVNLDPPSNYGFRKMSFQNARACTQDSGITGPCQTAP